MKFNNSKNNRCRGLQTQYIGYISEAVFFDWLLRLANSIYRLPSFLPSVCHVNLAAASEGGKEIVVGREGQKGCAVFWVAAVLCQIGAGSALELARLLLERLV